VRRQHCASPCPFPPICLPLSFPPLPFCCPFPTLSFTSFLSPLLFLLNPFPTLIRCKCGSGGITPGKFFNIANARRCVLVHCLTPKSVLYVTVLCQCSCIFVNRRLLASRNITPSFTWHGTVRVTTFNSLTYLKKVKRCVYSLITGISGHRYCHVQESLIVGYQQKSATFISIPAIYCMPRKKHEARDK
jgi:hypothetical protein